jgi:hypothetical protein
MLSRLNAYHAGEISLHSLVNDVQGLLAALEQGDPEWIESAEYHAGELEVEGAVAF